MPPSAGSLKNSFQKQPYNMHCMNKKVVFTGKIITSYLQKNIVLVWFHEYEPRDRLISENVTSDIKTSPINIKRHPKISLMNR